MNILSFDIEEWYLNQQKGGPVEKYTEYDRYLNSILDKLDEHQLKATFFCVGEMGNSFPEVIRRIQNRGHEIGCHSNIHTWLNKMTEVECREDTHCAVDSLQQCIGEKVKSYRAPAFSITEKNKWVIDILAECGIENDSSIFPTSRDFGGYPTFPSDNPCIISHNGITIREYPISLASLMGNKIAYSGGGYFRMLPYSFVRKTMDKRDYNICYFHLNDLINQKIKLKNRKEYEEYFNEPGTLKNRLVRYAKSNIGTGDAYGKLLKLLSTYTFTSIRDCEIDWSKTKTVTL
jgi:polysaccharide deacetylase family protein (PEP-CTERM system associated)